MPFALDSSPELSEISDAVNYLLANFGANLAADPNTGQISGPSGVVIAYLYKYLAVKYADSFDGSSGFSDSPTNKEYYGVNNSNSDVESTNPADYIWYKVAGGFGTTKFLFYQVAGGRQINFVVDTAAPDATYLQAGIPAIDLDIVTTVVIYQNADPTIYQWTGSSTVPSRPSTTTTYYWNSGTYTAPSGWYTSVPINTTPGQYLWAITIHLTETANVETSLLDWTSSSYPIYALSQNGSSGATGATGLSALTAYKVQSQSASTPSFSTPTSGATAPAGWTLTTPSVAVGEVLWYLQGQYNGSSITIDGVAPGTTAWTGPIAASVFQDIRSDNWNGSTPPVYGTPATYGTAGYYIQRSTGDCYFNDGVFRADVITDGDAYFAGNTATTYTILVNGTSYPIDYSVFGVGATSTPGGHTSNRVRNGLIGNANSVDSTWNVGVIGLASGGFYNNNAIGVFGQSSRHGGYFTTTSTTDAAVVAEASSGGYALNLTQGSILYSGVTIGPPPNNSGYYLRGDGVWASTGSIGGGTVTSVSGTGSVSGITLSGTVTTTGNLTLGGSLSLTTGNLTATAPGSNYYLSGSGWSSLNPVMTTAGANSGSATASSNTINFLGSTSTGIAGAYVGTTASGNTVTFGVQTTSPSDVRLKEEVQDADVGLEFVKQLRPVSYKLKADPKHQKGYGFIADEVEQLGVYGSSLVYEEPDWKVGDEIGFKTIHYPSYIAVLTKAIQELTAKVESLETQLKGQ